MKIYIFIITLISASIFTYSQNGDVNLEDIRIPNSPAFILLDVAPTSIDKPVNSKAFATSILNSLTENNGIPQNYAIEFTPYWYFEHPELDAFRYWGVNKEKRKNTWFSNVKQASISFAYVKVNDSLNLETFDNAALGVRLNLIRINKSKDIDTLIEVNERLIEALKAIDTATKDLMANLDPIDPLYKIKVKELLDSKENDVQLMELESQLRKFLTRKPLFSVDLASAANYCFSKNDFSSSFFDRYGIWMTASLAAVINPNNTRNLKRNYLNFYLTGRLISDNNFTAGNELKRTNNFDTGGKIELEFDALSISYEYLYRFNMTEEKNSSFRSSGLIRYKISDNLYLTGAFGRNFEDYNNLITQLGISWGLGTNNEKVKY